jgi:hypothetical protein
MALSHSRISDYDQCPLKFKLKYIDKADNFKMDDKNKSPHLVRGEKVHKHLEHYANRRRLENLDSREIPRTSLPEVNSGYEYIDKIMEQFPPQNTRAEQQLCVTREWTETEWFDTRTAYMRCIIDFSAYASNLAMAIDWKTGKFRDYTPESGYGQLELTAGFMFALNPEVDQVITRYVYVDSRDVVSKRYSRTDESDIRGYFEEKYIEVNSEEEWAPKRNKYCNFCEATKSQCPFAKREG